MTPQIVAGQYSGTFGGNDIGLTTDGFTIQNIVHKDLITADETGMVPIDATDAGVETLVTLRWIEYGKIVDVIGAEFPDEGQFMDRIGKLVSSYSDSLVLTPYSGLGNTLVFTATLACLENEWSYLVQRRHRSGPLTFRLFPDFTLTGTDNGRTYKWA